MIPTEKMEEWRALAEKATKGPWSHYRGKLRPQFGGIVNEVQCGREDVPIIPWRGFDECERSEKQHRANAAFIAASREAVPALLDEVERLREALEWIIEDGASDARAVECARAALTPGTPSK